MVHASLNLSARVAKSSIYYCGEYIFVSLLKVNDKKITLITSDPKWTFKVWDVHYPFGFNYNSLILKTITPTSVANFDIYANIYERKSYSYYIRIQYHVSRSVWTLVISDCLDPVNLNNVSASTEKTWKFSKGYDFLTLHCNGIEVYRMVYEEIHTKTSRIHCYQKFVNAMADTIAFPVHDKSTYAFYLEKSSSEKGMFL